MIARIETSQEILPIFQVYLEGMCRFYKIFDTAAWQVMAVKNLQQYDAAADHLMYGLKESGEIIGFALVNKHLRFNHDGFAIAEFFIQKDHQKKGRGRQLAEHIFAQAPGNWEVAVTVKNKGGIGFWKQVISSYTSDDFVETNKASFKGCGFLFNNEQG